MSELPERLRRLAGDFAENGGSNHPHCKLFDDAADEIERLAGNLRDCREVLRSTDEALQDSACEIERLTRELEAMEDARDIAQAEGALMEMDRDRLHAALEEYGRHESPCLGGGGDSRGCSCGFTKALGEPKP